MTQLGTQSVTQGAAQGDAGVAGLDGPLERCGPDEPFHDYVLEPYAPRTAPEGKLRSVNLLYASFAMAGLEAQGRALVERVRGAVGAFQTVFGIKQAPEAGLLGWELYFYDWARARPEVALPHLADALRPFVHVDAREPWPIPWHMFSIELTPAQLARGGTVGAHLYVDMRSYELVGDALRFENVYTFHDPRADVDALLHRLRASLHYDHPRADLAQHLPPSVWRCHRACVANKRTCDAVYFARVPTAAAAEFLARRGWPEPLQQFLRGHADALDHLCWDVGVDFHSPAGVLSLGKSGLYGSF